MAFSSAITSPSPLRRLRTSPTITSPSCNRHFIVSCNQKTDGSSVEVINKKPGSLATPVSEFGPETKKLDTPVRILVTRPQVQRTSLQKAAEVEVLHLNGVDVVPSGQARFDIYISAPVGGGDFAGPDYGEFAGSYVKPLRVHSKKEAEEFAISPPQGKRRKGSLTLGITPLLEDMGAENAEKLVVTLVPTDGEISVDGIGIKLLPADRPLLL